MEYKFTKENFETEVLASDKPVFIDFYADWCGPCKMMAPVVEGLAEEMKDSLKVGKVNVDEQMELAQKYRVVSIPNFVLFVNGEVRANFVGAMGKEELFDKIKEALS